MKGKRFSEEKIIGVLREAEAGDLCRRYATVKRQALPRDHGAIVGLMA